MNTRTLVTALAGLSLIAAACGSDSDSDESSSTDSTTTEALSNESVDTKSAVTEPEAPESAVTEPSHDRWRWGHPRTCCLAEPDPHRNNVCDRCW